MTPERWRLITGLFEAALSRDAADRDAFVDQMSGADADLKHEVDSLLAAHRAADGFGDEPVSFPTGLLSRGSWVGPYQVDELVGIGGMGEVYRAHDPRLGRDIALKLLPWHFTNSAERLASFEREARLLASLNHPHIGALYGLEEVGLSGEASEPSRRALVMEFVPGEDLEERLSRGPIPVAEALLIARQIADALEAAHEKGIVHRDLKPANIKIRSDGTVKLIDFGLATVLEHAVAGTVGPSLVQTFGTAAYMSPERAQAKSSDARDDVWAFGVVLYELLTGDPLYAGTTPQNTLSDVVEREPDLRKLPATLPREVRALIGRCLTKDPRYRLQAIGEARIIMESAVADRTARVGGTAEVAGTPTRPAVLRRAVPWTIAGALLLVLVMTSWEPIPPPRAPRAPVRVDVQLGAAASLFADAGTPALALSPDGATLAFVAQAHDTGVHRIYLRRLDQLQATLLANTDNGHSPFFSPDGQWLGFFADGRLKKIAVTGGAAVTLCPAPNGRGATWGEDGIVFSPTNEPYARLLRVSADGGLATPLMPVAPQQWHQRWPQILPGGKVVLYTGNDAAGLEEANLVVQTLPDGARRVVHRGGYYGRYLRTGHLLYINHGTLFVAPFDAETLEVTGAATQVIEGVQSSEITGSAQYAVASDTLVYAAGPTTSSLMPIHWMDRTGRTVNLGAGLAGWFNVHFAPDGRRLAMERCEGPTCDVWLQHIADATSTRLTTHAADDYAPVWTPGGDRITFASTRADGVTSNLYWQQVDRPDQVLRLTQGDNDQLPGSWHPGGDLLAFEERRPTTDDDLMLLRVAGDGASGGRPGTPAVFFSTPASEREPTFSPDGQWLAYSSNESGRYEIQVRPFPGPGRTWPISTGGGTSPVWSHRRPELFYASGAGQIMALSYSVDGDTFRATTPRPWSPTRMLRRGRNRMFDLHPDGDRVVMAPNVDPVHDRARGQVTFMFNFAAASELEPPASSGARTR